MSDDGMRFVTHRVDGPDGMVRALFTARNLQDPASHELFPGVRQVAILPRRFDSAEAAEAWMAERAERGGNAVAVEIGPRQWLVGAWVQPA